MKKERDEYLVHNKINISLLHHTNYLDKRSFGSGLKCFGLTREVVSNSNRHFSQRCISDFRGKAKKIAHAGPTIEDFILLYKSDLILLHNCTSHVPFYDLTN